MLETLIEAIFIIFSWPIFGWLIVGLIAGVIVGALPGLGATLGMAITLPLTLPLDGISAIVLLMAIYSGAMYGGSVASILINVPGSAASAATTFDGYPMSQNGMAMTALAASATASAIGGIITVILLIMMSPILLGILLLFQTPEYFLMTILGIAMITVVSQGAVLKGFVAGVFGLLITTVGIAPMLPEQRYTFGTLGLYDGLDFIAILIGMFAISEMFILVQKEGGIAKSGVSFSGSVQTGIVETVRRPFLVVKSSLIGLFIGGIPGSGAAMSNFFAYAEAMRSSKHSEEFGTGNIEGVISSETSNNATVAGSIIPTIAFGIPGSTATAVLLGGLIMHGLRPGPDLFDAQLHITYSVYLSLLIGSIFILVMGTIFISKLEIITRIDTKRLIPIVVVLSALGSYAIRENWFDVYTIVVAGIIGYYMIKYNYSIIAFTLGAVLGPIAEENYYRSMIISDGSHLLFVTRPLSLLIVVVTVIVFLSPYIDAYFKRD